MSVAIVERSNPVPVFYHVYTLIFGKEMQGAKLKLAPLPLLWSLCTSGTVGENVGENVGQAALRGICMVTALRN